jgi:murE/murF fusion protein
LSELIKACPGVHRSLCPTAETSDPDICLVCQHSGSIKPGALFIAIKGFKADGHDYMEQAFKNGAVAAIAEKNPDNLDNVIIVENSRLAGAAIADRFYGSPSKDLILVGITGTNGKTTTSFILENIFKTCGFSTGVIGTVNIRYNGREYNNPVTTPDAIDLQKILHDMKKQGVTHVIMEVSSHGLDLNRVDFCRFNAAIFTNLTQDHLDYHESLEDYFKCKKKLFTDFFTPDNKGECPVIINTDDTYGRALVNQLPYRCTCISTRDDTRICAKNFRETIDGLKADISMEGSVISIDSPLTGRFNLENILCAAAAAHVLGTDPETIKTGIENCSLIPGRLEKIKNCIGRHMFVDYAHTPDALESILTTLRHMAPARIITVFGCGGDRDRSKRPVMGKLACRNSDIVIVTSDNPRTQSPCAIIDDILEGLAEFNRIPSETGAQIPFEKGYMVEPDRGKAIEKAVFMSKANDIILVAGKGHETYQITGSGTIHFDDREELEKAAGKFADMFMPIEWTLSDIEKALDTAPVNPVSGTAPVFSEISIDSRKISDSGLFLALRGENFDGHDFVIPLIQKGIKGFIVKKGFSTTIDTKIADIAPDNRIAIFEVSDTIDALGRLAGFQRIRSGAKLVAVTGSSGKTTTRTLIERIFETRFNIHAAKGNFNNEIGLPLTLLQLSYAHEWAVVEMGMNHPGEIARLTRIAMPDIALITNTAAVHLEGLGSVENVARAKAEIFEGMQDNSCAILFADDPRLEILKEKAGENKKITRLILFGSGKKADIRAKNPEISQDSTRFTAEIDGRAHEVKVKCPGFFMVDNCLGAMAAAGAAGISPQYMQTGIKNFIPVAGRTNIRKLSETIIVIDDTYNANPASTAQALKTLKAVSRGHECIAVLADMLELGEHSEQLHYMIGKKVAGLGISRLFVHGEQSEIIARAAVDNGMEKSRVFHGTKDEIAEKLVQISKNKTWILVKGSRGMAMETVIDKIKTLLTINP